MNKLETIAGISTAQGNGGIAVIRISGEKSIEIADGLFKGKRSVKQLSGYSCAFGTFDNIDDVVVTVFKSPNSYTGEDVVEVSCHGGTYVARKIMESLTKNGAEPALAGEFTKRAFLNGKMSLTQAEAVIDIINANNSIALSTAKSQLDGALFKRIQSFIEKLTSISGDISAWIDYPEDDIPDVQIESYTNTFQQIKLQLVEMLDNYNIGAIINNGIPVAIVGKPNVGKSSLMNLLTGYPKSIVTDVAGTTRDVIEQAISLDDVTLILSDTAGIHSTDDTVEKIGVQQANQQIEKATIIFAVFDGSKPLDQHDLNLIAQLKNKTVIAIVNKSDLDLQIDFDTINHSFENVVQISTTDNNSVDIIKNCLFNSLNLANYDPTAGVVNNQRQLSAVSNCLNDIELTIDAINCGITLDVVNVNIQSAIEFLLNLTGENVNSHIVDEVFSRFCVGK